MLKNTIKASLAKGRSVPIPLGSKTFLRVLGERGLAFLRVAFVFKHVEFYPTTVFSDKS